MTKLTLNSFEKYDDSITTRFDCDFFVTCAGDGLWGCEAGRRVRVTGIDVIAQAYWKGVDLQIHVTHDTDWDVYTDTAFERAISTALGFKVHFTEQGMQEDGIASMEV